MSKPDSISLSFSPLSHKTICSEMYILTYVLENKHLNKTRPRTYQ